MGKGERVEAYVIVTSPINTALLPGALRKQLHYPEYPYEQALTHCQTVDKDAVADEIAQTLMLLNRIYKLGGISSRTRGQNVKRCEAELLNLPPAQQPSAVRQLQNNMRRTIK